MSTAGKPSRGSEPSRFVAEQGCVASSCAEHMKVTSRSLIADSSDSRIRRGRGLDLEAPPFSSRGQDLNLRPLGYEPSELPDCSTPHTQDSDANGR